MSEQKAGSQMRITDDERNIIKATFRNNVPLLLLLRKMFLPEIDPKAPLGQVLDLWLTIPTKDRSPELIAVDLIARNQLINHVENVLMQLDLIAKMDIENPEEVKAKLKADGTR